MGLNCELSPSFTNLVDEPQEGKCLYEVFVHHAAVEVVSQDLFMLDLLIELNF